MEGRMTNPNAGDIQGQCRCNTNLKARYEASPAPVATNGNKTISNKQKEVVVVVSDSSSSSSNNNFRCTSCPRKFSCQQALAGHCKKHKGEWLSRHMNKPDHRNIIDRFTITETPPISNPKTTKKLPSSQNSCSVHKDALSATNNPIQCAQKFSISNPSNVQIGAKTSAPNLSHVAITANAVKGPSPSYPTVNPTDLQKVSQPMHSMAIPTTQPCKMFHMVNPTNALKASPTNILQGPITLSQMPNFSHTLNEISARFPYPRPTNTFQGSSGLPPKNDFPNAKNTRLGPSLTAPQQSVIEKAPQMPITQDLNHPPVNCIKAQGKSTLGVRHESMIQKPSQPRCAGQSDMFRTGSPLVGREQMMGGNIRGFGNNNGRADLRSLSTAAGSNTTSRYVGGGSSNAHNLMYSRFQPGGGKRIEAHYLFPLSPHPIPHRPVPQPERNGEDVDLDLKLY